MIHINYYKMVIWVSMFFVLTHITILSFTIEIKLSPSQAKKIGNNIFFNECSGKKQKLIWWNKGEHFLSCGIGHCIWHPANIAMTYTETFPSLIQFLENNNVSIPTWLKGGCPWKNRNTFLSNVKSKKIQELQNILLNTVDLQVQFMKKRLIKTISKIINTTPLHKRKTMKKKITSLTATTNGIYALIDYLNFKGDGLSKSERYNNQGWGLYQVLEKIKYQSKKPLIKKFIESAKSVLTNRVANAPKEKHKYEKQWLLGWHKRIDRYLTLQ
jgi:hypothetical protein